MEKQYTKEKQKPTPKAKQKIAPAPIAKEQKPEVKEEVKEIGGEKKEEINQETKTEAKQEAKPEEKKEEKKEKKPVVKKEKAVVDARDLGISKKHSMAICDLIRGKEPEKMIPVLERVIKLKTAIPMKGEIPHRKGGFPGRYPVNACKVFIDLLKGLSGNASVNGIENPVITKAVPNDASRPFKRGGSARFKRTNVYLEAREKVEKLDKQEKKAEEKK